MEEQKTNQPWGERVGREVGEAAERVEQEVRKTIAYLNDEVVPQVRSHSTVALRKAAEQLQRLAEWMEKDNPKSGTPGGQ